MSCQGVHYFTLLSLLSKQVGKVALRRCAMSLWERYDPAYMYAGTWMPSIAQRPFQLPAEEVRHPQQEDLLLPILLRE